MNWREFSHKKVNLSAFTFGMTAVVALTRLSQFLPTQYYFSFAGFLYYHELAGEAGDIREPTHWLALLIKLAIPVLVGLLMGLIWEEDGIAAAGTAGFGGAFLLCWPGIVEWDLIANPMLADRRNQFLLLYAAYVGSFAYLCSAASRMAPGVRTWLSRYIGRQLPRTITIDWNKVVTELVKSAALAGASFLIGYVAR
jgi:hypothetical protein